ncbi:MAG: hypothetical protein ACFFFC_08645 [Candidatus Thorarchaeota archaeon]
MVDKPDTQTVNIVVNGNDDLLVEELKSKLAKYVITVETYHDSSVDSPVLVTSKGIFQSKTGLDCFLRIVSE